MAMEHNCLFSLAQMCCTNDVLNNFISRQNTFQTQNTLQARINQDVLFCCRILFSRTGRQWISHAIPFTTINYSGSRLFLFAFFAFHFSSWRLFLSITESKPLLQRLDLAVCCSYFDVKNSSLVRCLSFTRYTFSLRPLIVHFSSLSLLSQHSARFSVQIV